MKVKQQLDEVAKWIFDMMDNCTHKAHLPDTANAIRKKVTAICKAAGRLELLVLNCYICHDDT